MRWKYLSLLSSLSSLLSSLFSLLRKFSYWSMLYRPKNK